MPDWRRKSVPTTRQDAEGRSHRGFVIHRRGAVWSFFCLFPLSECKLGSGESRGGRAAAAGEFASEIVAFACLLSTEVLSHCAWFSAGVTCSRAAAGRVFGVASVRVLRGSGALWSCVVRRERLRTGSFLGMF